MKAVERQCKNCLKSFPAAPQSVKRGWAHYCSVGCRREATINRFPCDQCGAQIAVSKSQRRNLHHFCNHSCYAAWRKRPREIDGEPVLPKDRRKGLTLILENGELKQI